MEFKNWLSLNEMPIQRMELVPNDPNVWKKGAKRKYGWSDQDVGIVASEGGVKKFKRLWENTDHNYEFYLVRSPKAKVYNNYGEMTPEMVQEKLGFEIKPSSDAITVVFVGNTGDEKIPFTAWTAAHRMGHAFQTSPKLYKWREFTNQLEKDTSEMLNKLYHVDVQSSAGYGLSDEQRFIKNQNDRKTVKSLYQDIGTMKSARTKNIRVFFEFAYELLAQYLLTKNKIQFNIPAKQIITKYFWGHPQGPYLDPQFRNEKLNPGGQEELKDMVDSMAEIYNAMLYDVLSQAINKIFVM